MIGLIEHQIVVLVLKSRLRLHIDYLFQKETTNQTALLFFLYCVASVYEWLRSSTREARDEVSTLLSRRAAASNYTRALYSYFENGYFYSSAGVPQRCCQAPLSLDCHGYGISGLLALRCCGFTSATRAARLGLIPASFLTTAALSGATLLFPNLFPTCCFPAPPGLRNASNFFALLSPSFLQIFLVPKWCGGP
jgi:hypothetical protein